VVPLRNDKAVLDGLVGDLERGYEAFVNAHSGAIYSTALRLSGSRAEADDLAQETFVRAYRALRRFDAERVRCLEPRPWLLTITLNLWRNRLRSAARRPVRAGADDGRDVADPSPGPEAAAEATEATRAVAALLGELAEHHRVPVVLRHVVGLSYAEIASVLGCPVGSAKSNVARGLDQLRVLARAEPVPGPVSRPATRQRPRSTVHRKTVHRQEVP
jgi:RNA polymerase sigma-70 factor (ECF subfamily)